MSSTNRGGKRSESDNYPTPLWVTQRLLDRSVLPTDGLWYEPCAGEGAIIQACTLHDVKPRWYANELREDAIPLLMKWVPRSAVSNGDALDPLIGPRKYDAPVDPQVVITNPPFVIAWELLQTSLRRWPNAYVAFLLRLNFWGSVERNDFMKAYPPDTYVLPNRPDFKGKGKTDSIEYAWMVWPPAPRARGYSRICALDSTPLEDRRSSMSLITFPE